MYMHCARPGDCFWTSQTLFAKRYKDVSKPVPRWGQTTDLNVPGRIPRRDDQNGHMDDLIWSSYEEIMVM
jgi:hypothetical protein